VHVSYTLEYHYPYDVIPEAAPVAGAPYLLSYLEQGLTFDWRDDLLDPRRGVFAQALVREAHAVLGSDFDYIQLSLDLLPLSLGFLLGLGNGFSRQFLSLRLSVSNYRLGLTSTIRQLSLVVLSGLLSLG